PRELEADRRLPAPRNAHEQYAHRFACFPRSRSDRITPFVEIEVGKHRHDGPILEVTLTNAAGENISPRIAPSPLHHEAAPHFTFLIGAQAAPLLSPLQKLRIAQVAFERSPLQLVVVNPEEAAATPIKTFTQIVDV